MSDKNIYRYRITEGAAEKGLEKECLIVITSRHNLLSEENNLPKRVNDSSYLRRNDPVFDKKLSYIQQTLSKYKNNELGSHVTSRHESIRKASATTPNLNNYSSTQ